MVGHCCESGDLLTTGPNQPDMLAPRELAVCGVGDVCVIEGVGAYCATMSAKNYNSFPEVAEILRRGPGQFDVIRQRQSPESVYANEVLPEGL